MSGTRELLVHPLLVSSASISLAIFLPVAANMAAPGIDPVASQVPQVGQVQTQDTQGLGQHRHLRRFPPGTTWQRGTGRFGENPKSQ